MTEAGGKRVRLADIGSVLGVSAAAVSMALSGSPRVSAGLRARVAAVAAELGYAPNPAAAHLARQRGGRSEAGAGRWSVALLYRAASELSAGFGERCARLGLVGQAYALDELGTPAQAGRQLWARGVSGIVLTVQVDEQLPAAWRPAGRARLGWERFSLVKLSRSLADLPVDLVRLSALDYFMKAIGEVIGRGYRRVAVLMVASSSERDNEARHGAFLAFVARRKPPGMELAWRETSGKELTAPAPATLAWLREFRPDAVLCYHWLMALNLAATGIWRVPEELGLAAVLSAANPHPGVGVVSGCDVQQGEQVDRALQHLQELMARGERGFRERPQEQVVEPVWLDGDTLPGKPPVG
jgi:LacI family transcriptional regulator